MRSCPHCDNTFGSVVGGRCPHCGRDADAAVAAFGDEEPGTDAIGEEEQDVVVEVPEPELLGFEHDEPAPRLERVWLQPAAADDEAIGADVLAGLDTPPLAMTFTRPAAPVAAARAAAAGDAGDADGAGGDGPRSPAAEPTAEPRLDVGELSFDAMEQAEGGHRTPRAWPVARRAAGRRPATALIATAALWLVAMAVHPHAFGPERLPKPPEVLADRAMEIAATALGTPAGAATAGFAGTAAPQGYWLRATASGWNSSRVTAHSPPLAPGEAAVELDVAGRLRSVRAIPAAGGEGSVAEATWHRLFAAAGMDPDRFATTAPLRTWDRHHDEQRAWLGFVAEAGGERRVRVEAAGTGGRVAEFAVEAEAVSPPVRPSTPAFAAAPLWLLAWLAAIGGAWIAARSARPERGLAAAARLGAAVAALAFGAAWLRGAPSATAGAFAAGVLDAGAAALAAGALATLGWYALGRLVRAGLPGVEPDERDWWSAGRPGLLAGAGFAVLFGAATRLGLLEPAVLGLGATAVGALGSTAALLATLCSVALCAAVVPRALAAAWAIGIAITARRDAGAVLGAAGGAVIWAGVTGALSGGAIAAGAGATFATAAVLTFSGLRAATVAWLTAGAVLATPTTAAADHWLWQRTAVVLLLLGSAIALTALRPAGRATAAA